MLTCKACKGQYNELQKDALAKRNARRRERAKPVACPRLWPSPVPSQEVGDVHADVPHFPESLTVEVLDVAMVGGKKG